MTILEGGDALNAAIYKIIVDITTAVIPISGGTITVINIQEGGNALDAAVYNILLLPKHFIARP